MEEKHQVLCPFVGEVRRFDAQWHLFQMKKIEMDNWSVQVSVLAVGNYNLLHSVSWTHRSVVLIWFHWVLFIHVLHISFLCHSVQNRIVELCELWSHLSMNFAVESPQRISQSVLNFENLFLCHSSRTEQFVQKSHGTRTRYTTVNMKELPENAAAIYTTFMSNLSPVR